MKFISSSAKTFRSSVYETLYYETHYKSDILVFIINELVGEKCSQMSEKLAAKDIYHCQCMLDDYVQETKGDRV